MKSAFKICFLLFCFAISAVAQKEVEWIKYTSAEGRYSVSLPSEPKIGQQESTTADGIKFPQYKATSVDGSGVFMIGYFDYAAPTTFSFDKARDAMVSGVKGALISEDSISLGGSPGRQLKVSAPADGVTYLIRARFYDVGGRVYMLQYIFPKDEDGPAIDTKAGKFFDSFSVKASR